MFSLGVEVAAACGVTRLADVTRLDQLGVPVWQAVRPLARSLTVHQGKGLDCASARVGALMEAIEFARAEAWNDIAATAAWRDLEPSARPAAADDFAVRRGGFDAGRVISWSPAQSISSEPSFLVPFSAVSMDFTWDDESGIARSSDGTAAHYSLAAATRRALHELIERDARAEWRSRRAVGSLRDRISVDSVKFPWFCKVRNACRSASISVRLHRLPSLLALPAFFCELLDADPCAGARAVAGGADAHEDAEIALRGAVLEAAQSRLTVIAGTRDDLDLDLLGDGRPPSFGLGFPTPPFFSERRFKESAPCRRSDEEAVERMVEGLARAGYRQVGRVLLSPGGCGVPTVKMFVPGLGSGGRDRRRGVRS